MDAESTTSREEIISERSYREGYQKALWDVLSDVENLQCYHRGLDWYDGKSDAVMVIKNRIGDNK